MVKKYVRARMGFYTSFCQRKERRNFPYVFGRECLNFILCYEKTPQWWVGYTNIKHSDIDKFMDGNLRNALNALAALAILYALMEWCKWSSYQIV